MHNARQSFLSISSRNISAYVQVTPLTPYSPFSPYSPYFLPFFFPPLAGLLYSKATGSSPS